MVMHRETGQDSRLIMGGREYGVENVEDNFGETELAEADSNMKMESYTAPAGVSHSMTVTIDGSAVEADNYLYDGNFHPRTGRNIQLVGGEYGTRGRQGKATSRPRTVPSKDGTSIEFEIRFDDATRN
jgi:hypothetical protein